MSEMSTNQRIEISSADQVIALLGVYAAQAGSYTTLLWQVPALSLTAQSFLLTIALTNGNGTAAKVTAAALSVVISAASYALMHDQRGHAINHGELAMRLSGKLALSPFIDTFLAVKDGMPRVTDADKLWTWHKEGRLRAGLMYAVWKGCLVLFLLVDIGIICSVLVPIPAAVAIAAVIGIAGVPAAIRTSHVLDRKWMARARAAAGDQAQYCNGS
jgi:hypothetical protein